LKYDLFILYILLKSIIIAVYRMTHYYYYIIASFEKISVVRKK